jgi:hypothetical protein
MFVIEVGHYAMKTYGEVEMKLHALLTWKLHEGEWSSSHPSGFIPKQGDTDASG